MTASNPKANRNGVFPDTCFVRGLVSPQRTLQLRVPVSAVFIDYFSEDVLQGLVGGFSQSVGLRIIRCTPLVYDHIKRRQALYYWTEEMSSLITDQFYRASILAPNVLV